MHRRKLLKGAAAATLLLSSTPLAWHKRARAQVGAPPRFFLSFAAQGAWDMSLLGDPKGGEPFSSHYNEDQILSVPGTNITYAPKTVDGGTPQGFFVGPAGGLQEDFFLKYGADLLVLRGVDTQTNSHDIGPRHVFSGNIRAGHPAFGALVAAVNEQALGQTLPMSFMSTGGFDNTENLLPPSRVGNVGGFLDLAQPYRLSPSGTNPERFHHEDIAALVHAKQAERQARLFAEQRLPRVVSAMEELENARAAEDGFDPLYQELRNLPTLTGADANNPLIAKAQIAIAAMLSGQCVSANLSQGGFDTHANHDVNHPVAMQRLLDAVAYTRRTLEAMGLWDETVLMMGSDFSRTVFNGPPTSTTRGKDHWPITHVLFMGKGISGGRVVGATDDASNGDGTFAKGARAMKLKLEQGELGPAEADDPTAEFLRPPDIMASLRDHFGVRTHAISVKYPVGDTALPLLPLLS